MFNGSIYACYFVNHMTRSIQRNIDNKYVFFKSLNIITPWPTVRLNQNTNKKWCQIIFNFLQFKIHLNLLTDTEYEFFFNNCQEYLTAKTNGYNYFREKCFKEFDFVAANEKRELNETLKNKIFTDFLFLITNIFIFLVVALPIIFVCRKSYDQGFSSSNEIINNLDILTNDFSDN